MEPKILQNAIMTPDGTILKSVDRRKCIQHTDTKDGKTYAVDGGIEYFVGAGYVNGTASCLHLTERDSYETIVNNMAVQVFDGNKKLIWKRAKDCSLKELVSAHLNLENLFPNGRGGYSICLTRSVIHFVSVQKELGLM